jgi:hypothetical protein
VLRRIFGPKTEEVVGEWGRLHNEELHNLYTSPNIIRVIKLRRVRWTVHTERIHMRENIYITFRYSDWPRAGLSGSGV